MRPWTVPNVLIKLHEKVTLDSVQLPKSWAGNLSFVKRFQAVMVHKLGLSLGGPLDAIYHVRNLFGNFPGTLPWSLRLPTSAFLALRIVQPHLLSLPIRFCSRSLVIYLKPFMRLSSRWELQAVSAPRLYITDASIPVVQLLDTLQGLLHSNTFSRRLLGMTF